MARPRKLIPNYRRHTTGQAVVTIDGKDFYLGPYGTAASKAAYDRIIGEWIAGGRTLIDGPGGISIARLMVLYMKYAGQHYQKLGKPTSEVLGIKAALRFLKSYTREPADSFGPLALKAVRNKMVDAGWARVTVNRGVDKVRRMFRWAASEQLIPAEVATALGMVEGLRIGKTTARETAPVLPVDDAVVEATLPHLPPVVADMVRLQRLCGMRPQDVCAIRPCDIDRTGDVWIYRPEHHKTEHHGRRREVAIGPQGQAILLRHLARAADSYCFSPVESEAQRLAERHANRKTPLSCGTLPGENVKRKPKRKPGPGGYPTATYRRAITRACDKAFPAPKGLKEKQLHQWQVDHRWAPNRLRHTAGTEVRKMFGLEAAQVVLGHAKANMTERYAERDRQQAIEVAKRIG